MLNDRRRHLGLLSDCLQSPPGIAITARGRYPCGDLDALMVALRGIIAVAPAVVGGVEKGPFTGLLCRCRRPGAKDLAAPVAPLLPTFIIELGSTVRAAAARSIAAASSPPPNRRPLRRSTILMSAIKTSARCGQAPYAQTTVTLPNEGPRSRGWGWGRGQALRRRRENAAHV